LVVTEPTGANGRLLREADLNLRRDKGRLLLRPVTEIGRRMQEMIISRSEHRYESDAVDFLIEAAPDVSDASEGRELDDELDDEIDSGEDEFGGDPEFQSEAIPSIS
jgi:hypothetical protein